MQDHSKIKKCIFEWSKEPKYRFLAIFRSLVWCIDLILHIVIELNVFQHLATLPGHEGSFKDHKDAFMNDPKGQKRGFRPFSGVWSVRSSWYCILWQYLMFSNVMQRYQVMKDHSKIAKMHFWMIQRAKKEVFCHFLKLGLLDRLDITYCESTKCLPTLGWRILIDKIST